MEELDEINNVLRYKEIYTKQQETNFIDFNKNRNS